MSGTIRSWLPVWSKGAALRAVRATIVVAGLFALCEQVIGNRQMATFAAFGGFATLVLASFAGSWRDKLIAHVGLAIAGSVLLSIGTLVTSSTALAVIVTVPVTFAVFFAGIAGPNAASGVTGALLAYVLPAASPGAIAMIPDRLIGWWLASIAGTAAVLLLSTRDGPDRLRAAASKVATALADELDAALRGAATDERLAIAISAKHELLAGFTATPYRPTGLAAADQALAQTVELLEWCTSLVIDAIRERNDLRDAAPGDRELVAQSGAVLRDVAAMLAGRIVRPDLDRLERCRTECRALLEQPIPADDGSWAAAQLAFHAHAIALAVLAVGAEALVACRIEDPGWIETQRRRWYSSSAAVARTAQRVTSVAAAARTRASLRSVWFINSLRGAVALAAAVGIADVSSVQHGFWVVLGTLSVLRTNAASTGSTAVRALTGTVIGFVIGGVLLVAIGSSTTALWVALPIAVFVAAYAPGTAPFAIGQAAFTVTVAVLFNLLAPVGWKVGILRLEDVAIGCAVSIVVGCLFWPRGVSALVGDDLADAYRTGAFYLAQAVDWAVGARVTEPDAGVAATTAALRLDDALRGFLAERGTKQVEQQELWRLVGGSLRLRLTAHSVAELPGDAIDGSGARDVLERRASILTGWYERLAELVDRPRGGAVKPPDEPRFAPGDIVTASHGSQYGVWLCEYLDHLREHVPELARPAVEIAEVRRRPWWR
jgi:uncharacterized membrane protein YccC